MERSEPDPEQGEQQRQRSGGGNKRHCSVSQQSKKPEAEVGVELRQVGWVWQHKVC